MSDVNRIWGELINDIATAQNPLPPPSEKTGGVSMDDLTALEKRLTEKITELATKNNETEHVNNVENESEEK